MGFKDDSNSVRALKRRAVAACRNSEARKLTGLSEIDCIGKTMNGDVNFILDVTQNLKSK